MRAADAHGESGGGRLEDLLLENVRRIPSRPALVDPAGPLTWAELAARVGAVRGGLLAAGVRPRDVVALSLPNGAPFVATFLAAAGLGATTLPLNPAYTRAETLEAIGRTGARAWIVPAGATDESIPGVARIAFDALGTERAVAADADAVAPALLLITSGSTGRPKLIPRTAENLVAEARHFAATTGTGDADSILGAVPLQHAHGLGNGLLASLASGAKLVLLERFHRADAAAAIRRERVTLFPGVPLQFAALAETATIAAGDLATIRLAFSAGAPLTAAVFDAFLRRFGHPVRQLYGCSEAGSVSLNLDADAAGTAGSVGRPMRGVEVAILGTDGAPLGADAEGEIAFRSRALSPGYLGDADLVRRHFRDGWFRPGDLGRLDAAGRLWLTGRQIPVLNVSGLKVDPTEVERALSAHPAVAEAAVVGVPSRFGDDTVKAVVVARAPVAAAELLRHCAQTLAPFKVPKIVEFRNELPRNPLGKLLRKDLLNPFEDGSGRAQAAASGASPGERA